MTQLVLGVRLVKRRIFLTCRRFACFRAHFAGPSQLRHIAARRRSRSLQRQSGRGGQRAAPRRDPSWYAVVSTAFAIDFRQADPCQTLPVRLWGCFAARDSDDNRVEAVVSARCRAQRESAKASSRNAKGKSNDRQREDRRFYGAFKARPRGTQAGTKPIAAVASAKKVTMRGRSRRRPCSHTDRRAVSAWARPDFKGHQSHEHLDQTALGCTIATIREDATSRKRCEENMSAKSSA